MIRALCVGECMIELRSIDNSTMRVGYAGDTYNTAVYFRRTANELGVDIEVGYLTGLGSDEHSADMRASWEREGVADRSIAVTGYLPGLYTVRVDHEGERRFSYWRSASTARKNEANTSWVASWWMTGLTVSTCPSGSLGLPSGQTRRSSACRACLVSAYA